MTSQHRVSLHPGEELQPQPVDVLLLGSVLRAIGDLDWEVMRTYAVGVPLGLGVDMPCTPAVFPQGEVDFEGAGGLGRRHGEGGRLPGHDACQLHLSSWVC